MIALNDKVHAPTFWQQMPEVFRTWMFVGALLFLAAALLVGTFEILFLMVRLFI